MTRKMTWIWLLLLCEPLRAQTVPADDLRRVTDDLAKAASLVRADDSELKLQVQQAREQLREFPSKGYLIRAEATVTTVYENANDRATALKHLKYAIELSERLESSREEDDLAGEFEFTGHLVSLLIHFDQYPDAYRIARSVRKLADANSLGTNRLLIQLTDYAREAILDDSYQRADAYERAIDILAQGDAKITVELRRATARADHHLALGEYGTALTYAVEAHKKLEILPGAKKWSHALIVLGLRAKIHLMLGQRDEALKVMEQGESLAPDILAEDKRTPDEFPVGHWWAAKFHLTHAQVHVERGNFPAAEKALDLADSVARHPLLTGLSEYMGIPRVRTQIAHLKNPGDAKKAREALAKGSDPVGTLILDLVQQLIAKELTTRQLDEFVAMAQKLIVLASREDKIQLYVKLAHACEKSGDTERAIKYFATAIQSIEESRVQSKDSEAIPGLLSRHVDVYASMVAALYRYKRPRHEEALAYAEAARARQFSDRYGPVMMDAYADAATLDPDVRAREKRLRAAAQSTGFSPDEAGSPAILRERSNDAIAAYAKFIEEARKKHPKYADLAFPRPLQLKEVEALPNRFIVSYMVTEYAVFWWVITERKLLAAGRSWIVRTELRRQVTEFVRHYIDMHYPDLFNALVREPFGRIAEEAAKAKLDPPRVIVIPDDVLHAMPWEALRGVATKSLGDAFVISYAPSLTVLQQAVTAPAPPGARKALLIGNTQEQPTAVPGLPKPFLVLRREAFDQATGALKGLGFETDVMQGADATVKSLLSRDLKSYSIVHFDTHGFAERTDPPPSLLLRPTDDSPFGLFTMDDVRKLKLKARLVTLSACQTALDRVDSASPMPGEGIEAFARLFMLAGAKSVLATLWNVPEHSAGVLVERFYQEMQPGKAPDMATALFRAKAHVRERLASCDYWAGFILIGDPRE